MAQTVKSLPAVRETQVQSLVQEDPLEKEMATHSSILAWRLPIDIGAWWVMVQRITKVDMIEVAEYAGTVIWVTNTRSSMINIYILNELLILA